MVPCVARSLQLSYPRCLPILILICWHPGSRESNITTQISLDLCFYNFVIYVCMYDLYTIILNGQFHYSYALISDISDRATRDKRKYIQYTAIKRGRISTLVSNVAPDIHTNSCWLSTFRPRPKAIVHGGFFSRITRGWCECANNE